MSVYMNLITTNTVAQNTSSCLHKYWNTTSQISQKQVDPGQLN